MTQTITSITLKDISIYEIKWALECAEKALLALHDTTGHTNQLKEQTAITRAEETVEAIELVLGTALIGQDNPYSQ